MTRQKKIIYLAAFSEDGMLLGQKLDMGPVTRIGSASGITLDQWTAAGLYRRGRDRGAGNRAIYQR